MTSDAGWYRLQTKAIGTITPSGNIVVERVTAAILADFPEVSGHFSRIPVFGTSDAYKDDYDWDGMLGAARLLAHAHPDVICWNGSKGVSLGFEADHTLCARIRAETGIAATTSVLALDRPCLAAQRRLPGQGNGGIRGARLSLRGRAACGLFRQFLLLHCAG